MEPPCQVVHNRPQEDIICALRMWNAGVRTGTRIGRSAKALEIRRAISEE